MTACLTRRLSIAVFALALSPFCLAETTMVGTLAPDVLATRGDAVITFDDIDARMRKIPADKRAGTLHKPDRLEKVLQDLLLVKQLAAEARRLGLADDPLTKAEMQLAVDEILARRRVTQQLSEVTPVDYELIAKERFVVNPEAHRSPETVSVRHLLIKRDQHGDAEAKRIAESLRAEFIANGGDFAEFVKKHSEEPKADLHGGLVSDMVKGQAASDFESAAFDLKKPGDLSPVISTRFGYHIIQLVSRTESKRLSFDEVKAGMIETARKEHIKREAEAFLERLRNQPMNANPDNIASLRERYLPDGPGTLRLNDGVSAAGGADAPADEAGASAP